MKIERITKVTTETIVEIDGHKFKLELVQSAIKDLTEKATTNCEFDFKLGQVLIERGIATTGVMMGHVSLLDNGKLVNFASLLNQLVNSL